MRDPGSLDDASVHAAVVDSGVAAWSYDFVQNRMTRTKNHDALYGIAPQDVWVVETFLNATHPEDRHLANQHIARCVVKGGADHYRFEFRVVWPDQSVHWLDVVGHVAARGADGVATRVHGVLMDITAQREALSGRDELLQVASHELNTPLQALSFKLAQLERRGIDDDDHAFFSRQLQRMTAMVRDLLEAGRIGADTVHLRRHSVALSDIVVGVVDDFSGLARRAGCDLSVDVVDVVAGTWDRQRLEQVVANLLMNALKYGAGKPVRVVVDGCVFVIEDEGVGIEAAALDKVFRKFGRAPSAGRFGGLGLGLYVAKGIVDAHGGVIDIDSVVGRGTRFTVRLPR